MKCLVALAGAVAVAAGIGLPAAGSSAQRDRSPSLFEGPLITDRPATAYTVGALRLQLETSFEVLHDTTAGVTKRSYSFPTLLRFGIIDPLEFRVGSRLYEIATETGRRHSSGFGDITFGFKTLVHKNARGTVPALGVLAQVRAPAGDGAFSSNAWVPEVRVIANWCFPYDIALLVNLGVDVPDQAAAGGRYARFLYAVTVEHNLRRTKGRLSPYGEFVGETPVTNAVADQRIINVGLSYLITPDIEVDGSVQFGITDVTPDVGGALSWGFRF